MKDNENANARPSRMVTRSKPPSNSNSGPALPSKASVLVDASAHKRKREALGEVTAKSVNNIRARPALDPKGKGKETVTVKPTKPTTTSTTTATTNARPPLRTVTSRTRPTASKSQKEETMAVDRPAKVVPVVEIPAQAATFTRTTSRVKASTSTIATTAVRRTAHRKVVVAVESEVEAIDEPLSKRRRTSSEVGDDALLENIAEESEPLDANVKHTVFEAADQVAEQDEDWDDLDRDDDDDPLMVSEYVVDIFNYLKQVEVRLFSCSNLFDLLTDVCSTANYYAES